jgi:hypothetical protein
MFHPGPDTDEVAAYTSQRIRMYPDFKSHPVLHGICEVVDRQVFVGPREGQTAALCPALVAGGARLTDMIVALKKSIFVFMGAHDQKSGSSTVVLPEELTEAHASDPDYY